MYAPPRFLCFRSPKHQLNLTTDQVGTEAMYYRRIRRLA